MLSKELSLLAAASFPLLVAQLPWPTRGLREEEKTLGRETGTPERRVETVVPPYAPPPNPGQGKSSGCPWCVGSQCWGSAGSTGAGDAQHCRNLPYPKICRLWGVRGCKPLPNSCSNSSLLSLGQKGALPARPSSLIQREGAKGAFLVKFPLSSPPLGPARHALSACPTRATLPRSGGNRKRTSGFYESRHLSPLPAWPRKSAGHKRLHQ